MDSWTDLKLPPYGLWPPSLKKISAYSTRTGKEVSTGDSLVFFDVQPLVHIATLHIEEVGQT